MKICWKTLKQPAMNVQRNAKTRWATTQTTGPGLIDFLGEKISKTHWNEKSFTIFTSYWKKTPNLLLSEL